jgi:hypothetical protein
MKAPSGRLSSIPGTSHRRNRGTGGPGGEARPSPGTTPAGAAGPDLEDGVEATVTIGPVSDALDKLQAEHRLIEALLGRGVSRNLPRLRRVLLSHARLEREVLHPALRRAAGDEVRLLLRAAGDGDEWTARLLDRLRRAPVEKKGGLARELRRVVEEHVRREEKDLYPVALRVLDRPSRVRLGERMDILQAEGRGQG